LNAKKSALLSWGTLILFLISMGSSRAPASAPSVRINAGATSSFADANRSTWLPDQYFTGGATYANSNKVPLANGNYNVSLDFAETYVSGPAGAFSASPSTARRSLRTLTFTLPPEA
jgi:hypothetical protein